MSKDEFIIKNPTITKQIKEKTEGDPKMQEFLLTIIKQGASSPHYKKKYNEAIDEALKGE